MDQHQEQEVARGLRRGEVEAWQALYDTYAARVWSCAARAMGTNSAEVADVVQETFLAAARSARSYDATRGSLWLWLSGIARKHVALYFRKQQRRPGHAQPNTHRPAGFGQIVGWLENREPAPGEALDHAELRALVRSTLTALPPDYEMLLTAKYFDGASVEEIAGRENRSPTAIRSKLARARRAFRRAFARQSANSLDAATGGDHEA